MSLRLDPHILPMFRKSHKGGLPYHKQSAERAMLHNTVRVEWRRYQSSR